MQQAPNTSLVLCVYVARQTTAKSELRFRCQAVAAGVKCAKAHLMSVQFLVLVFLKRNTPPLLLVVLNYMRLFRLLRLMRLLKVCNAWHAHLSCSIPILL